MKGCLKFFAIAFTVLVCGGICLVTLGILFAPKPKPLTAEQRAALNHEIATKLEEEKKDKALRDEAQAMHEEIIAQERPKFLEWLTTEGHCLRAQFTSDTTLNVELPRLLILTKDDARVRGEEIAERWAVRAGWDRVVVSVYYGNEVYAEGIYAGGVPKLYLLKTQALKALKDKAAERKKGTALPEIEGWSWHDVTKQHGAPQSQDTNTGWAVWPTFKARFSGGTVQAVSRL